jgi:tRNA 2-thiouridine synthesizing protein A
VGLERQLQAAQVLDCKGLRCPMPIVKLSKAIKSIAVGEVIELWTTDPTSVVDLEAFQKLTGHELLTSERQGGAFRFLVKRTS